jgi:hypothetical protein
MKELKITQYNMQKSSRKVMAPFLTEAAERNCDIIAVQEPWQNTGMNATYCPSSCGFWPAYPRQFRTRACFLISKKIPLSSWTVSYPCPDFTTLTLQTENYTVHIHNIYSQPPGALNRVIRESPIYTLAQQLNKPGEHMLIGDFNLHHPSWGGARCFTRHSMAIDLLQRTEEAGLQLLTPSGMITWERGRQSSTIDLTFCTQGLAQKLVRCAREDRIENSSDHFPISTSFTLDVASQEPQLRRCWKKMDREGIAAGGQHLRQPASLNTVEAIEEYTNYLFQFLNQLVEVTVPWSDPTPGYTCKWWTPKVRAAVHDARVARRNRAPADVLLAVFKHKRKTIGQAKRAQFRQDVHKAAVGKSNI